MERKRKEDAASVLQTYSSHLLPAASIDDETDLTGARGKRRGVSPGSGADAPLLAVRPELFVVGRRKRV